MVSSRQKSKVYFSFCFSKYQILHKQILKNIYEKETLVPTRLPHPVKVLASQIYHTTKPLAPGLKVNFLLRKIFRANLNGAILLVEIDVKFKVTSISGNEILHLDFHGKFSLNEK